MTIKPDQLVSPIRRHVLKSAGLTLAAGALPFGAALAQPQAQHHKPRYRRWRASSHSKMGTRMLKSYAKAVNAMLALPPEDPRNWYRQAIVHTLDCPHGNWWFLPWHRGYLGWFEGICRELSGDPQFALPYWDWTAEPSLPDGMFDGVLDPNHAAFVGNSADFEVRLASAVANAGYWTSPDGVFNRNSQYGQLLARSIRFDADVMFDILRDPSGRMFFDQPGARGLVRERPGFSLAASDAVSASTIQAALAAPDFITFASAKTSNHHTSGGFGILEARPHNSVHRCVGSRDCNFTETRGFMADMLSPVDPVFFLHHANIDRLWDVWTRRQLALGLPVLPAGLELRTDLPDSEKSPEERATDYFRWAREPLLFFVDAKGEPVKQTRNGDYVSMSAFDYDYEPGSGEEMVPGGGRRGPRSAARRVYPGKVVARAVRGPQAASALVQLPAGTLENATAAGQTMVANVTLSFPEQCRDPYAVILNGPDDPTQVDTGSPFYLATIVMFGHRGATGPLSFSLPLGEKLQQARANQPQSGDGALRLRVLSLHELMGHHHMAGQPVELLAASVETY